MALLTQKVVSKTPKERRHFIWKIEDFALIRSSTEALEAQRFYFEMGASIGLPTRWTCYLECQEENCKVSIGVFVELDKASVRGHSEVLAALVSLKIGKGLYFCDQDNTLLDYMKMDSGWGCTEVIPQLDAGYMVLPLDADGSLSIDLQMVIVNLQAAGASDSLAGLEFQFKAKFKATFEKNMTCMFHNLDPSSSAPMLVKVVSRDGMEFLVNRGILAARSDVFSTMFQQQMSEAQEGVIKVDDVSGPAIQAFLSFVHTGVLPADWKKPGVVEGFTYAAHKYLLQELVDFLDQVLGMVCTSENCAKLVKLAKKLDMSRAEAELTKVLREQLRSATFEEMEQLFQDVNLDE